MSRYIDLTGQRFGRLVVKERAPNHGREGTFWLCQCDCGKTAIVAGSKLRSGHTAAVYKGNEPLRQTKNSTHFVPLAVSFM